MTRVLGLDISSSCIGIALLDLNINNNQIKLLKSIHYQPTKKGHILERLLKTKQDMTKIIVDLSPDIIAIEDIIQFMGGGSTAKTIISLASFNRTISLVAYEYLGQLPTMYNVMSIRHGLKLSKELPKKELIPELVSHHLNIKFPYVYKKDRTIDIKSYDRADAIAVALYQAFILSGRIKRK